jgi:cell division protein ZapA (FtsZ GTPase activity inhibitor)
LEKHSIILNIFGRQFPARVDLEEAAVIEKAADAINAKIKAFKAQYKTQDDLDIAIMCSLDIMTEFLKEKARSDRESDQLLEELSQLEQRLDTSLEASGA